MDFSSITRMKAPEVTFKIDEQVKIPDLKAVQTIPRGKPYSTFIPSHREAANALIKVFRSKNISQSIQQFQNKWEFPKIKIRLQYGEGDD